MDRSREGRRQEPADAHHRSKDAPRFASHGSQLEQGKADLYNACEWGNYSRSRAARSKAARSAALLVTYPRLSARRFPGADPAAIRQRQIGVPFFNGTHIWRSRCSKACAAQLIKLGRVPNGSPYRFRMLMDGRSTPPRDRALHPLAEKKGCRPRRRGLPSRTEVASDRVDAETYSAFNRAVREAVRRINANKRGYLHYFIDYYKDRTRRSPSSPSTICARAGSSWSIRRRSRRTSCSAPTTG